MTTFAHKLECLQQWRDRRLNAAELLLQLQCDPFEIAALKQIRLLPDTVIAKQDLRDWDDTVTDKRCRAVFDIPSQQAWAGYYIGPGKLDGARHVVIFDPDLFAQVELLFGYSEGQGSVLVSDTGEIAISGNFTAPNDVKLLKNLLTPKTQCD